MIKSLFEYSTLTAAVLMAGAAFGQTQVPNTFQPGSPALASEVNENFDALAQAVQVLESTDPVPGPAGPQGSQGPAGQDAVVDSALVQTRVSGACVVGSFISAIAEDGSVTCGNGGDVDANTQYGEAVLVNNVAGTGVANTAIGMGALQFNTIRPKPAIELELV
jgi:hypothetical protein